MNIFFVDVRRREEVEEEDEKVSRNTLACSPMFLCSKCLLHHYYHIKLLQHKTGLRS